MGELQERLRAHFRSPVCQEAADELDNLTAEIKAVKTELAGYKQRLSDMSVMYSDAVDVFKTGYSGYEAVLLGQEQRRIFKETGKMSKKSELVYSCKAFLLL